MNEWMDESQLIVKKDFDPPLNGLSIVCVGDWNVGPYEIVCSSGGTTGAFWGVLQVKQHLYDQPLSARPSDRRIARLASLRIVTLLPKSGFFDGCFFCRVAIIICGKIYVETPKVDLLELKIENSYTYFSLYHVGKCENLCAQGFKTGEALSFLILNRSFPSFPSTLTKSCYMWRSHLQHSSA